MLEREDKAESIERLCSDGRKISGVLLERRPQPPLALFEASSAPEAPQHGREPQPQPYTVLLLTGLQGPRVGLAQVRKLAPEPPEPQPLIWPQQLRFGPLGEGKVVSGVPAADLHLLPTLPQLVASELPDR